MAAAAAEGGGLGSVATIMTYRLPVKQYSLAPAVSKSADDMHFTAKVEWLDGWLTQMGWGCATALRLILILNSPPPPPLALPPLPWWAQVADFGKSRLMTAEGVADSGGYATITHMAPEVRAPHGC